MEDRRKLLLIMNPKSGVMLAPKYMADIIERFSRTGFLTQVLMTTAKGDARDFAHDYGEEADLVVVSGGDGTLNEVIDGLISGGHDIPVGYIPSGSTNDFANSVGLPKNIFDCVDGIIYGTPHSVDIGSFNGRYFSYVASFGAFTSTTYSVPQNIKNILGHSAYVMAGIKELAHIKSIHARIILEKGTPEEEIYEGDYILGGVCNSRSIGGIVNLEKGTISTRGKSRIDIYHIDSRFVEVAILWHCCNFLLSLYNLTRIISLTNFVHLYPIISLMPIFFHNPITILIQNAALMLGKMQFSVNLIGTESLLEREQEDPPNLP